MSLALFLFLLIPNTTFAQCECIHDALDLMLQNKTMINEKLEQWQKNSRPNTADETIRKALLTSFTDITLQTKDSLCNRKVIEFLRNMQEFNMAIDGTYKISAKINIKFLANLLRCDTEEIANRAWNLLYYNSCFSALRDQSTYIKQNLKQSRFYASDFSLLSLLDLTKIEKDSLLSIGLPLQYKANVGDTAAIDSLIFLYHETKCDKRKSFLADVIMASGRELGVKAVLADFSDTVFTIERQKTGKPCTTSTYQKHIIMNLTRYFPGNKLFTSEYDSILFMVRNLPENQRKVQLYWNKLREFFWQQYRIKIAEYPPFGNIFRSCGPKRS